MKLMSYFHLIIQYINKIKYSSHTSLKTALLEHFQMNHHYRVITRDTSPH